MKKGILFDLDGTLWDSSGTVITAWNECIAKNTDLDRTYTAAQMKSYMGKTLDKIADEMFPDLDKPERLRIIKMCGDYENAYMKTHPTSLYFPREKETLGALAEEYFLAVVSNCQDGYIQIFLEQCGFGELFGDFECARTGLCKGDNIKLVAERNKLDSYIYVGDTELDCQAALRAGVKFVHAAYGFGKPSRCDGRVTEFSQLPAVVAGSF